MEIKINIEESRFKDILEKELAAFSQEETHKIIAEAMHQYLMNDELIKKLFIKDTEYYGRNEPTALLSKVVNQLDIKPAFDDVKNKIIDYLSKDDTVKTLTQNMFADMFQNAMRQSLFYDNSFMSRLTCEIANNLRNGQY